MLGQAGKLAVRVDSVKTVDGRPRFPPTALYARQRGEAPVRVYLLGLSAGRRKVVRGLMPRDPTGVYELLRVLLLTPDASCHAYAYTRQLSDLYLIEGLR
jgi:hypothetical protein